MTRNKKKLRRLERLTGRSEARHSRAVAGTLVAGTLLGGFLLAAPDMASAAASFNPAGPQTYTEQITVNTAWDSANVFTGSQTFTQGIVSSGSTNGVYHGILGGDGTSVVLSGGTSSLTAGAGLTADSLSLTGGSTTVSGTMAVAGSGNAAWRAGSMLQAQSLLNVSGQSTTLELGNWGQAITWGDGRINIVDGATVNMTSSSGDQASLLRVSQGSGKGVLTVGNGGKINVANGKYGYLIAPSTVVDGKDSRIKVESGGFLVLQDAVTTAQNAADAKLSAGNTPATGVNLLSGNLVLKNGGRLNAASGAFTHGSIQIDGAVNGSRSGIYGVDEQASGTYAFGISGGSGTPGDINVGITGGGGIEGQSVTLHSGTYTVSGTAANPISAQALWRQGSMIMGYETLAIGSKAVVNVGDNGLIGVDYGSGNAGLSVAGTVNLKGSSAANAATMIAFTQAMNDAASGGDGKFSVSGGAINATGYGRLVADTVDVESSGGITVANGGHLLLSQGYADSTAARQQKNLAGGFDPAYALQVYDAELNVKSGGTVTVNGDAVIKHSAVAAPTGKITVNAGGGLRVTGNLDFTSGSLNMAGGTAKVDGTAIDASLSALETSGSGTGTLTVGALQLKDAQSTFTANGGLASVFSGLGEGKSIFNGAAINVGDGTANVGTLTLAGLGGAYNGANQKVTLHNAAGSGGTLAVNGGSWNLGHVNVSGSGSGGKLDVRAGRLTIGSLTSEASETLAASGGTTVAAGAGLTLHMDDVLTDAGSGSWTNKVLDSGDGATVINGTLELLASGKVLDQTDITAIKTALGYTANDKGLLSFTGAQINLNKVTGDPALNGTVSDADAAGLLLKDDAIGMSGSSNADVTTSASLGADSLVVKDTSTGGAAAQAEITLGGNLTLIGAQGDLVAVKDSQGNATGAAVKVTTAANTLNLGDITAAAGSGKIDELNVSQASGGLRTSNGEYSLGKLTVGNNVTGSAAIAGDSTLTIESAAFGSSSTFNMTVGDAGGKGTLIIKEGVDLKGSTIFMDPAWVDGSEITDASQMAIADATLTAKVTAGQNSWFLLGSENRGWVTQRFNESGLTWGANDITAATALYRPVTLDNSNGGILVDGSLTASEAATANKAEFRNQSLLMVNAGNLNGQAALTSTGGTAVVDAGARLLLADVVTGVHTILDGFSTSAANSGLGAGSTGWAGSNLLTTSYLLEAARGDIDTTTGKLDVTVSQKSAGSVLPGISSEMAGLIDSMYRQNLNDTTSANAGIRFASRSTDRRFLPMADAANVLEGAAQIAQAGGAPGAALGAANVVSEAMAQRTNIAAPMTGSSPAEQGTNGGSSIDSGLGVWAMPLYQHEKVSGMKAGSFNTGYKSDLYGGIIGLDVTNDALGGKFRLGVALNVGTADVKSNGDFGGTDNDVDFWGASLYAGWRMDRFALSADLGYTSTSNDIKQDIPASLDMGSQLKSDVDASVYSAGLKAEYTIPTDFVDITPNVGIRYRHYRQDSFNVNSRDGDVFNIDKADMDTWTFPIGVTFSRDFEANGWQISPQLDLRYIPAAGDLDIRQTAKIPGMPISSASLSSDVVDRNTGEIGLGLNLRKDAVSFGLNYDYQGSKNRDAHGVSATFRYEF